MDTAYGIMHCRSEISDRSTCHLEATATAVGHHVAIKQPNWRTGCLRSSVSALISKLHANCLYFRLYCDCRPHILRL